MKAPLKEKIYILMDPHVSLSFFGISFTITIEKNTRLNLKCTNIMGFAKANITTLVDHNEQLMPTSTVGNHVIRFHFGL